MATNDLAAQARVKLEAHARAMSEALLLAVPLGGSECFVSVDGVFYADPKFIGDRIVEMKTSLHRANAKLATCSKALSIMYSWPISMPAPTPMSGESLMDAIIRTAEGAKS